MSNKDLPKVGHIEIKNPDWKTKLKDVYVEEEDGHRINLYGVTEEQQKKDDKMKEINK